MKCDIQIFCFLVMRMNLFYRCSGPCIKLEYIYTMWHHFRYFLSINVPLTDPDITYSLDNLNITPTSPTLIYSRYGIYQTSHQYKQPLLYCAKYPMAVVANLVHNNLLNYYIIIKITKNTYYNLAFRSISLKSL